MDPAIELVVFADDWGRHPSSAQHLVGELLRQGLVERVVWVNTIGMRTPKLRWADVKRGWEKLRSGSRGAGGAGDEDFEGRLKVVSPRMYPGFRSGWQRRLNAWVMRRAVEAAVSGDDSMERVGLTTLPITADLMGSVYGVDRWVYYCVDDFSVWPGVDHGVMERMEPELVRKVDAVVCVSEVLRSRVERMLNHEDTKDTKRVEVERQDAKTSRRQGVELLTHGVNAAFFDLRNRPIDQDHGAVARAFLETYSKVHVPKRPRHVFWGLLDERLDMSWLKLLNACDGASVMLVGPGEPPSIPGVVTPGFMITSMMPNLAALSDTLIMPYRDIPVTRAMQPLKLLEYLATYKPVVVRDLPATRGWGDCCDVVSTAEDFVRVCRERAEGGLPEGQRAARERRLAGESWSEKARVLHRVLRGAGGAGR
ncbi:MAG: hypothetical protein AAF797_09130 [Planctomycetota bacterium]